MVPVQIVPAPVTAAGCAFTVTVLVEEHPVTIVYDTVVVPGATPNTTPELFTVTMSILSLLHVPPEVVLVRVVVCPSHTDAVPAGVAGIGLMVTTVVL